MTRKRNKSDANKKSFYIRNDVLTKIESEAKRLDRTVSWIVQYCIRISLAKVATLKNDDAQLEAQREE